MEAGCLSPEEIAALLAGQLSPAGLARAEEHIDVCASCRIVVGKVADASVATAQTVVDGEIKPPAKRDARLPAQIGRYEVQRVLGAGGMGVVLLAEDSDLKRAVVIKLLRPGMVDAGSSGSERLLREAQAMAKVSHVNVVPIYDVGVHDGQVFLAMEYLEGGDLAAWLKEPRPLRDVLAVFVQAGRGLAAAHRAGLVHRDFKPHNVLLGKHGEVKVTDFGLARTELSTAPRALDRTRPRVSTRGGDLSVATLLDSPLTHTGATVGTPAYMAPEQILAEDVDARTDQFSFCVALHEALYGVRPFAGSTTEELFAATLAGRFVEVTAERRIPARVRKALRRGLGVEPAARFATMDELLRELAPRRRAAWIAGGAVTAAVAAAAIVAVLAARGGHHDPCAGLDAALAGAWDPDVAQRLHAAFAAAGAANAAPAVVAALDRHAASWTAVRVEACRATRVRGDQPEEVLARKVACLDTRVRELRAFSKRIIDDAPQLHARAAEAAARLVSPTTCANAATLAMPTDHVKRYTHLEEALTNANLDFLLDSPGRVRDRMAELLALADSVPYPPLQADAYMLAASTSRYAGDLAAAESQLRKALQLAEVGQYDLGRARATIALAELQVGRGDLVGAEHSLVLADATLARIGGDPEQAMRILEVRGNLAKSKHQLPEALALFERLRDERGRAYGEDSLQFAAALVNVASIHFELGRTDEGRRGYDRAQQIIGKLFPDEGGATILTLSEQQTTALMSGDPRRAVELAERGLALLQSQPGLSERLAAQQHTTIGVCRFMLEEYALARDAYARAAALYERLEIRTDAALNYELAGRAEYELGRHEPALALFRKSAALAAAHDPEGQQHAMARQGIGRVLAERGAVDDAIAELEWALPRLESRQPPQRNALGNTRLALAEALWRRARPGDRDRARTTAALAREDLRAHRAQFADADGIRAFYIRSADKLVARADAWIAAHR